MAMCALACFLLNSCKNIELKENEYNNSESILSEAESEDNSVGGGEILNRVVGLVNDGENGSKVLLYDTDTWEYEIVAALPDVTPDNYAALSSNNKKLAYTTWNSDYTKRYVKVYDRDKQETADYLKDIPSRTEIIKISWIPDSDLLLYVKNDTNYNNLQTIEILDTVTGRIKVVDVGEVWQIRTLCDADSTASPFYLPGSNTYLYVKYKDYSDDTDNEIWNYYLDSKDLADIYEKYGGVREFDFSTIGNRMYVEFSTPRCSPNGKYIVYSAKLERTSSPGLHTPFWVASAIWLYNIESGETHIIYKQEDEGAIGRVDWINDSELCFVTCYDYQGSRDNINYYSIESGKSEVLFHYSDENYNNAAMLPIGNQKITFTSSANGSLYSDSLTYVLDIRTKESSVLNVSYNDKSILLENFIYYIESDK